MLVVRYVLPGAVVVAGIVIFLLAPGATRWAALGAFTGAGVTIFLLNLFYRVSVGEQRDRHREARARRYYERHGRWPGDADRG
jgi:hypothetical protein